MLISKTQFTNVFSKSQSIYERLSDTNIKSFDFNGLNIQSTFADQNVQVNVGMVRKMGCSLSILTLFVHAGNLITDP
ncbi:hypothetical protein GCM10022410_21840 [Amphibacillus indicireducens]|uniref:Uncharacterized protein n=1 Tax=Amphibacillus indicireducens TaxID=1076330 RepID=A0ABP7VYE3_9BACI